MFDRSKSKAARLLITALGLPVAIGFLLAKKVHFHTIAPISENLMRLAPPLKECFAKNPLAWTIAGLGVCVAVLLCYSQTLFPVPLTFMAFAFSLVWIDCGAQEVGRFPRTTATVVDRCNRTWVRHLKPELRDIDQLPLVRHVVDCIIVSGTVLAGWALLAGTGVAAWLMLIPTMLVYMRTNELWQEIVHIDSHTRFMRPRSNRRPDLPRLALSTVNLLSNWWLSQFYGMFPGWYLSEHVGNHHPEINSKDDVENLQDVDRTSFIDFAMFAGRIIANTFTGYGMYGYFRKTKKYNYFWVAVRGAVVHTITITTLFFVSAPLGTWLLAASAGFGFSLAIIGITDHGLADPLDPGNVYRNSYNVLWTIDDHGEYGQRYHLTHHLRPAPSWGVRTADLALQHQQSIFAEHGSILFHPFANPDDLLRAYWNEDADYLYPYVASVGKERPSLDDWRRIFRARIRPATAPRKRFISRWVSRVMTRLATSHISPPPSNLLYTASTRLQL